jgi:hypothetical protein
LDSQGQMSGRISPRIRVKLLCYEAAIYNMILAPRWMKTTIWCNRAPMQLHLSEEREAKPARPIDTRIIFPSIFEKRQSLQ